MPAKNLTDSALKAFKPKDRPYKPSDGTIGGLHVVVYSSGKKVFRLTYAFHGKTKTLTIGSYPEISLAEAREKALEAKKQIQHGQDPNEVKKAAKEQPTADATTFRHIASKWLTLRKPEWSPVHFDDTDQKLNLHVLPRLGDIPIAAVSKADIKAILDTLQAQSKFATRKKVNSIISQVMQYALVLDTPGVVADFTQQLKRQYSTPPVKNRAALTTPAHVGGLMRAIEAYNETSRITAIALKFSALTFCRPGEIRQAEWVEIDLTDNVWRIPESKMKAKQPLIVPLARQTQALLEHLRPLTGHSRYLFPSTRTPERPMSEATITVALRRMNFSKDEMCAHGFRGTASTLLNEKGFNRDWIERQLAHGPKDKVRAAYNHSEFLADRCMMMQWWADYLDELAAKEQSPEPMI